MASKDARFDQTIKGMAIVGSLAFFPWLSIRQAISTLEFELVPYERGTRPGGPESGLQRILDTILEPYVETNNAPIRQASLLRLAGHDFTDNLTEPEVEKLFTISELVAFSGLAKREFFGFNYANCHHFTFIVQTFEDPFSGVTITSRRRDGLNSALVARDALRVARPFHASPNLLPIGLDFPLLQALLSIMGDSVSLSYWEPILLFNRANTDSDQAPEHAEAVFLIAAFQGLLECRYSNENGLAESFSRVFQPAEPVETAECDRLQRQTRQLPRAGSVREMWIRDFFRVRGELAHGLTAPRYPSIWSLREHLLLASYVFPRLVKLCLANNGFYTLSDDDRLDIDVFEPLACCENLFAEVEGDEDDPGGWPWNRIREEGMWHQATRKALAHLSSKSPNGETGAGLVLDMEGEE